MGTWRRTAAKWVLGTVLAVVLLIAADIAILAFPQPLFSHKSTFGEFTIYSDEMLPDRFEEVVEDARERVAAMEGSPPGDDYQVFLCNTERSYSLFAFLTRRGADSLAIGMSAFDNLYLNESKIKRFADRNHAGIMHSRFEGNYAEVIAHEIAHFNIVDAIGYRASMKMPVWKSEGYAEYQANLAATRADPSYDFRKRVDLLLDDTVWGGSNLARKLFEWHLLVEFLAEEQGVDLHSLIEPSVTEAEARADMLAWYADQH